MAHSIEPLIHHLRKVLRPPSDPRLSDGQLLRQFIASRDESAFEAMVRRHGKMVFCVCRRLLRNVHDAEDAFQATFLVLSRKADSVSKKDAVGNWLYGVAYRTAMEARVRNSRRRSREQQVEEMAQPVAEDEEKWQKLVPFLDQELVRLPDKYRLPIVLCELEGRSRKEVARQLGLPEGTLSSRLATARKMLAKRLAKYGPLSGGVVAAVLSQAAEASIPPTLVSSTLKAALGGSSVAVVALAQGVLKAMFISKLKTVSLVMALAVSITVGAVGLTSAQQNVPAPPIAETTKRPSALRDELEVLRLEIEALRKDLNITKDRVQTLESEIHALKGKGEVSASARANAFLGQLHLDVSPVDQLATAETALKQLRQHPEDKKLVDTLLEAVKRLKETPRKAEVRVLYLTDGIRVDPFIKVETALKQLRQHPNDKPSLAALERAVNELKQPKANTALPTTSPR